MNEEKKNIIKDYITIEECEYLADDVLFDCDSCSCFEHCYMKSCERCNEEFAESVGCCSCGTEDDFWEQI